MAMTFLGGELNPMSKLNKAVVNMVLWCSLVWIVSLILYYVPGGKILLEKLAFTPAIPQFFYQPWSIFTYIFMHADFWHLFGNMLWLFFIGMILEDLLGRKTLWKIFIWGGICGALFYSLFFHLFLVEKGWIPHLVGASAGVSAIVIAAATFTPRFQVFLFGILPVELIWIAVIKVVFDVLGVMEPVNQGGYLAHLGGGLFGLLYSLQRKGTINIPFADDIGNWFKNLFTPKKKTKRPTRNSRVTINRANFERDSNRGVKQEEIDRILDKINQSGYESLSKEEKETLFRAGD